MQGIPQFQQSSAFSAKFAEFDKMLKATTDRLEANKAGAQDKQGAQATAGAKSEEKDESAGLSLPPNELPAMESFDLKQKIQQLTSMQIAVSADNAMATYDKNKDGIVTGAELGFTAGGAFGDMSTGMPDLKKLKGWT